jgi:hypothetical protein
VNAPKTAVPWDAIPTPDHFVGRQILPNFGHVIINGIKIYGPAIRSYYLIHIVPRVAVVEDRDPPAVACCIGHIARVDVLGIGFRMQGDYSLFNRFQELKQFFFCDARHGFLENRLYAAQNGEPAPQSPTFRALPSSTVFQVAPLSSDDMTLKISVFASVNSFVVRIIVVLPLAVKLES